MELSEFEQKYKDFQLGELPTETPHSDTIGLGEILQNDMSASLLLLKQVDQRALEKMETYLGPLELLKKAIAKTFDQNGRVFLCGCGATGRLSLLIESLWREKNKNDQVQAFMAGGDVALVHSLEGFEDYPELGEKHLVQLGFTDKDLLISSSEGGETPFVIGATQAAAQISNQKPFFLYCNPSELLKDKIPRSKQILTNPNIESIELFVGPMALSGSTRMQASTILQLAIGWCLLEREREISDLYSEFVTEFRSLDYEKLKPFIEKEHQIYNEGEYVMYMPRSMALTVFTDTTERSPTFSLPSFENERANKEVKPSLCYVLLPMAATKEEAWLNLIGREPLALEWQSDVRTRKGYLESFDFSRQAVENREERLNFKRQYLFEISIFKESLHWSLGGVEGDWDFKMKSSIGKNTLLKMMLNAHSTLLMGKMDRYQSNIMTWVKPTNGKLVDRAIRYVTYLLREVGITKDYLEIARTIYKLKDESLDQKPIVLRVFEEMRTQP